MVGLLNLRNTPQEGLATSPVQRLFGRRTKTLIPCANSTLTPAASSIIHSEKCRMENKKAAVAQRYIDRRELPSLQVGDTVRMQPISNDKREWQEATVSERLKNRSYEVTASNGRTYRRSRTFLRSSRPSTHSRLVAEGLTRPYASARSSQPDDTTGTQDKPVEAIDPPLPASSPSKPGGPDSLPPIQQEAMHTQLHHIHSHTLPNPGEP